jgi:hypothetical protein
VTAVPKLPPVIAALIVKLAVSASWSTTRAEARLRPPSPLSSPIAST